MKERLRSVQRILSVQGQICRIGESRLALLRSREAALHDERAELVAALNEDTLLHGLFIEARARRVRSVAAELGAVERERQAQVKRLLEATGRLKRVERVAAGLDRAWRAEIEKRALAELIDRLRPFGA